MANLETLELTISANAESASKGIDSLITSLSSLSTAIAEPFSKLKSLNEELKQLITNSRSFKMPNVSQRSGASSAVSGAKKSSAIPEGARLATQEEIQKYGLPQNVPNTKANVAYTKEEAQALITAAKAQETMAAATKESNTALAEQRQTSQETVSTFASLKKGFSNLTSGISTFFSKVKRIATTMLIRKALRSLVAAVKTGVSNLYEWSKLNNGEFASSVNSLKSKVTELKNSIGASIAPVISAAIPVINSLASAAIEAFNWVNQLISLLSGKSTWTKATEVVDDYTDAVNGAGSAASDWIATFDELNVMTSSSGGGSSTSTDYSNMFEEMTEYDAQIRSLVDFLNENMESIKDMAIATGVAILGWKLSEAFSGVLPTLSTIFGFVATGAVIAITLQATWMLTSQYLNTGDEGWLFASALTTAIGSTAAWAVAKKLIGGQAGLYAASITLALSAITDITANIQHSDVSALSQESILTNVKAALEMGAAAGIAVKAAGVSSLSGILTAAAGAALITFGVATALKVITDKTNTEWDSKETIVGAITAAIPVGLGLFVLGAGAIPATIAAIATFGVVLAVKAMMPKSRVTFGELELSDADVQAFVEDKMFTIDVNSTIGIIADQIEITGTEKNKIGSLLEKTLTTYNVIQLGVANDQDYTQMKTDVDNLISQIGTFINEAKNEGKLTIQYTPTLVGDSDVETGEWYTNYDQGWTSIQEFVEAKGKLIGEWLTSQEGKAIKDATPDIVQEAMDQLTAVTEAIAQAKVDSEAFSSFSISLGDLDETSFDNVITKFKEYKENLTKEYEGLVSDQIANQAALVEALKITIGDDYENDPKYQEALAKLQEMGKNASQAVKDGVESASEPGKNMIMDWMIEQLGGTAEYGEDFWYDLFETQGLTGADLSGILRNVLEQGLTQEQLEVADLVGFTGWHRPCSQ